MSDASRLAKKRFTAKSPNAPIGKFSLSEVHKNEIRSQLIVAARETAFSAAVTYVEAIAGLKNRTTSWSIIRLYYSCYYCIKSIAFQKGVVPFNSGSGEFLYNAVENVFIKGGKSSHHWNWNAMRKIASLKSFWFYSEDSEDAYTELRSYREDVNYRHKFPDPEPHACLIENDIDINRRIRSYRDDSEFLMTYLKDHLTLAYPTRMIFETEKQICIDDFKLEPEKASHLKSLWNLKDRCPFT